MESGGVGEWPHLNMSELEPLALAPCSEFYSEMGQDFWTN